MNIRWDTLTREQKEGLAKKDPMLAQMLKEEEEAKQKLLDSIPSLEKHRARVKEILQQMKEGTFYGNDNIEEEQ